LFDQETINESLRVAAQLIDWNALETFEEIVLLSKKMLIEGNTQQGPSSAFAFRKNCMRVL
jgi:hypothetical protein